MAQPDPIESLPKPVTRQDKNLDPGVIKTLVIEIIEFSAKSEEWSFTIAA